MLKKNIISRGRKYEQNIEEEYLRKLENGYWDFFKQQNGLRILVIDTNDVDFVNNENDYNNLLEIIQSDYNAGIHRILLKS